MTTTGPRQVAGDATRVRSLDGVRGLAALIVVLHHAMQLHPTFARVQAQESAAEAGAPVWALTHTPLHVLWAGEEAVLIFFVLSGFVLTLPATRGPVAWRRYYPRRLVRLYLPVWASVALAVALRAAFASGGAGASGSTWLHARAAAPLGDAWHDAVLLDGTGLLNSPLWSLRWEVLFSLALPLYVLALRRTTAWGAAAQATALMALIGVGTLADVAALRYLPVFGLGVVVARHQDLITSALDRLQRRRRSPVLWSSATVVIVVLLTARWLVDALPTAPRLMEAAASAATIAGAVAVVLLPLCWPRCASSLESPGVQWLGTRSFSLYLVHEPVIIAVALVVPVAWGVWPTFAIGLLVALGATDVFYRLVERPSISLARAVGALRRPAPAPARPPSPPSTSDRPAADATPPARP